MLRLIAAAILSLSAVIAPAQAGEQPATGANGLHVQDWFHSSSLNLQADLQLAGQQGKDMMIVVEQVACSYCRKLHAVNFAKPEILDLIKDQFITVQLDLWGERPVTDFDGEVLTEEALARKWGVATTPTTIVLSAENPFPGNRQNAEAFRLPGYLDPIYHYAALDFFSSGAWQSEKFAAFVSRKSAAFLEKGIDPETW